MVVVPFDQLIPSWRLQFCTQRWCSYDNAIGESLRAFELVTDRSRLGLDRYRFWETFARAIYRDLIPSLSLNHDADAARIDGDLKVPVVKKEH